MIEGLFNQMAQEAPAAFATVGTVLFGGEAPEPKWIRSVLEQQPPQRLLHVYGCAENSTWATCCLIEEVGADAATVPIGRPLCHTQCYVLDRYGHRAPIGAVGQLHLSGPGLARG